MKRTEHIAWALGLSLTVSSACVQVDPENGLDTSDDVTTPTSKVGMSESRPVVINRGGRVDAINRDGEPVSIDASTLVYEPRFLNRASTDFLAITTNLPAVRDQLPHESVRAADRLLSAPDLAGSLSSNRPLLFNPALIGMSPSLLHPSLNRKPGILAQARSSRAPYWCVRHDRSPCTIDDWNARMSMRHVLVLPTGYRSIDYDKFRGDVSETAHLMSIAGDTYSARHKEQILYWGKWQADAGLGSGSTNFGGADHSTPFPRHRSHRRP
jgi:hypothetical protein